MKPAAGVYVMVPSALSVVVPCAPLVTLVMDGALVPGLSMTITPASVVMLIANTRETDSSTVRRSGVNGNDTVAATRSVAPSMIVSVLSVALPT